MPDKPTRGSGKADRPGTIALVKTPLNFFVLIVLVVEGALGAVVVKGGDLQQLAMWMFVGVLVLLVAIVAFFAYRKPAALLRGMTEMSGSGADDMQEFGERICGEWWESITPREPTAISYMNVWRHARTGLIEMNGRAYSERGELAATWDSVSTCVDPGRHKLFYYWTGHLPGRKGTVDGFGEVTFFPREGRLEQGTGFFSDSSLEDASGAKQVVLARLSAADSKCMHDGAEGPIAQLIRAKFAAAPAVPTGA